MKHLKRMGLITLTLMILSVILPQATIAADDVNTMLARTTAKGYLTSLKLDNQNMDWAPYYLTPDAAQSDEAQMLTTLDIDSFEITDERWVSEQMFQAVGIIRPAQQEVTVSIILVDGRWQIDDLQLGEVIVAPVSDGLVTNDLHQTDVETGIEGTLLIQPQTGGDFYLVDSEDSLRYVSNGIDPILSPDGTQVAFTRWTSGNAGSVWIYDLVSGQEWQLLGETQQAKSPAWSADGTQLIVSFQHGGQTESREVTKARGTRPPANAYDISIGSETGRISYTLPADPHWQLRVIDVATGRYEDLASATYSTAPTWDPVNDWRVIFETEIGLQQLDLNRNENFAFTADVRDNAPVISPDGRLVAVTYHQHDHWEIYTISTEDGTRTRLTSSPIFANQPVNSAAPAWSPDGSKIIFVTDRAGDWEYWIMDADGDNQQPLLSNELADDLNVQYNGVSERLISWVP